MAKITFVGAGSTVFARNLLRDLFLFPELRTSTISLYDIDPERLADTKTIAQRLAAEVNASPVIDATTDRIRALTGSDYVITMVQVGGYRPATVADFEIPKRYGLRQTIGDTLGIGGIMRALRTIPVLRGMVQDLERVAPSALHLNYTNPMAMICMALNRTSHIRTVGLCHSVQGTAAELEVWLGIPAGELEYTCAGINHMAFYQTLTHQGRDVYPELKEIAHQGRYPAWEEVRFEVFRRFGYFVTESSEHLAEYVPWFIKSDRPDLIDRFGIPLDEYPARCEDQISDWAVQREALVHTDLSAYARYREMRSTQLSGSDERRLAVEARRNSSSVEQTRRQLLQRRQDDHAGHSGEYATLIIHGIETGTHQRVYGNVPNNGLITNLPDTCTVEVPCTVDAAGLVPEKVGELPIQLAALMQTNINVQQLTVEAAVTGRRDYLYQAAMLDPHTAAVLDPEQICALVDELLAAHGDLVPSLD